MWEELRQIGRDLPGDIRVVVVRGEGRAFSAGLDLSAVSTTPSNESSISSKSDNPAESGPAPRRFSFAELAAGDDLTATETIARFQEGFGWLRRPDLVSIAAVRGHAIGAGFQLALACDATELVALRRTSASRVEVGEGLLH